jgi:glycine oxidase
MDQLRAHSTALFPSLSAELRERTAIDNGYLRCGAIGFPNGQPNNETDEWRHEGVPIARLDEAGARQLEPALGHGLGAAFHIPDMAQLRNPRHLRALLTACHLSGVILRPGCPVDAVRVQNGRVVAVVSGPEALSAGKYLLTAGAWTDSLLGQVGWRPGVRPIRGQIALLNPGAALFSRVLVCGLRYLVPRPDGRVLVGSTEEDAGFVKHTTALAVSELLSFACRLVPVLAKAPLERCWAGLRPGSPDGLPFIGAVPEVDNLYVAAGHFRAGIGLSPATALVVKELILRQPLTIPIDAFRLNRVTSEPTFRS